MAWGKEGEGRDVCVCVCVCVCVKKTLSSNKKLHTKTDKLTIVILVHER